MYVYRDECLYVVSSYVILCHLNKVQHVLLAVRVWCFFFRKGPSAARDGPSPSSRETTRMARATTSNSQRKQHCTIDISFRLIWCGKAMAPTSHPRQSHFVPAILPSSAPSIVAEASPGCWGGEAAAAEEGEARRLRCAPIECSVMDPARWRSSCLWAADPARWRPCGSGSSTVLFSFQRFNGAADAPAG